MMGLLGRVVGRFPRVGVQVGLDRDRLASASVSE
jgi:hypothetical protein